MQAVTAVVQILRKASELVTLLQPLYNVGDGVGDLDLDVDNLRYVNSDDDDDDNDDECDAGAGDVW